MNITVDYGAISQNAGLILNFSGKRILAVLKNNAYNFGLLKVAETLLASGSVSHFATASSEEAVAIKKAFPQAYVLQFNPATAQEISDARAYGGIALSVGSLSWLEKALPQLEGVELHLKFNAGMNRFGFSDYRDALTALDLCKRRGVMVTGLMSHFPLAEEQDSSGHDAQVLKFREFAEKLMEVHSFSYIHAENTATILRRDSRLDFCNFIRPGIMLYGYSSLKPQDWLQPALYATAKVVEIRRLKKGDSLGYGTSFSAPGDILAAVVDAGYGDGLLRLRKEAPVAINGKLYPIISKIFMSHLFVEVDDNVSVGDAVEIYGREIPVDYLSSRGVVTNSEQTGSLHII